MVEASKEKPKAQSSFSLRSSPKKPSTSIPPRELKKRKGVSFEELPVSSHPSTSDYLYSQNKEWSYLASCFNLVDESHNDQRDNDDAELYGLCDWFEEEAGHCRLNDDSDENLPLEIFAEQGMRIRYQTPTAKPSLSLSSLRLNSLLRLESRPRISAVSRFESIEEEENTSGSLKAEKEDLEKAFKGVLPCSNSQKVNKRRSVEKAQETPKMAVADEEDFWDQVEF